MPFSSDFDASAEETLRYFGESGRVTYTAPGAAQAVILTAIVGREQASEQQLRDRRLKLRERRITIHRDPDSEFGGVADPALNATVTVDDVLYHLHQAHRIDEHLAVLVVRRSEAMEISRPDHRGRR